MFADAGARIIAVSDSTGGILNPAGLDPLSVLEHKRANGSIAGFPGSRPIGNRDPVRIGATLLSKPCRF
ncbi:MAG: hypothetical protein GY769_15860 [bacterium]|nr:hypothetical protein [bacterium]